MSSTRSCTSLINFSGIINVRLIAFAWQLEGELFVESVRLREKKRRKKAAILIISWVTGYHFV